MQLELTLGNDRQHVPTLCAFLHTSLAQLPPETPVADQIEHFVCGAAQDAIAHAYSTGDDGLIKLSIDEQHGKHQINAMSCRRFKRYATLRNDESA